jgi:hypothetical protein
MPSRLRWILLPRQMKTSVVQVPNGIQYLDRHLLMKCLVGLFREEWAVEVYGQLSDIMVQIAK